jgi:excisionase family DNA binding protein
LAVVSDRIEAAIRELAEALREELGAEARAQASAPDRLLSIDEAAQMLGVGRTTLYQEIQAGRCRSITVGRRRLIPESALAEYVNGSGHGR